MALRWIVMAMAACVTLAFIWYRNRHGMAQLNQQLEPGRAVIDEAAVAFEDVARQFIQTGAPDSRSIGRSTAVDLAANRIHSNDS